MKKFHFFFAFLLIINGAMAQWPSNCETSATLEEYYQQDVKDMAVQWLFDTHSPDTGLIDIPQWCQDTIWAGLAAINNRIDLPEVDSVFNKYCVHRIQGYVNIKTINVHLDPSCPWLNNWINLQITTGVATLDSLLSHYQFTLNFFSSHNYSGYLSTPEMINLYALCDSLESFDGITDAYPDSWGGVAAWYDHIYFNDTSGVKNFIFQISTGLSGCYRWKFLANADCSIEFLGTEGLGEYEIYEPIDCNLFTDIKENNEMFHCKIFPNPANDRITVSAPELTGKAIVSMYAINGGEVTEKRIINAQTQIDVSNLPPGVYFLKITGEMKVSVEKFIKQ